MGKVRSMLAAVAAALAAQLGGALASDDVFVVPRVPITAQAESATAAKIAAQMQGRRRAMDILLRRLTIEDDWIYLPRLAAGQAAPVGASGARSPVALTDHELESLESSFEVYSEKSSATTYRAYITYRFKPDAVRRLLKTAHLPYSETQTRTALVVPVLQTDSGVYLWESNNPWMAAWKARPYVNELTPMTAPLGDLDDTTTITAQQALELDAERLGALADRYAVSQVIVAHARLKQSGGQDQLTVRLINGHRESTVLEPDDMTLDPTAVEFEGVGPSLAGPLDDFVAKVGDVLAQATFAEPSGNFPALAERAIESALGKYSTKWKARTLIDHSSESILEATAFFESIADWTKIRAGLVATPLVNSVQVFALSPRGAEMRLKVFGDPSKLVVAMENYGVVFWTETGERWFLATPRAASALRGSRALRRRVEFEGGADDPDAPRIEPASNYDDAGDEPKIEQRR